MRHKIGLLFIVVLAVLVFASVFTACNGGKYQMQDFIVDFEEFAKTYEVGDQVDLTKIKMSATFSDGTQETIPLDKVTIKVDGVEISLNELSKITETTGTKIIEIKYSNVVRNVTIKVNEKHIAVLTGVEFDATDVRKQYSVNDTVSLEGLVVKAVYDGYDRRTIALTDENLAIFMGDEIITNNLSRITASVGEKTIKVRYMTILTEEFFTIQVSDVLESVVVSVPNTLKTSYKVEDAVSFTGITASATYRSGRVVNDVEVKYYLGTEEITSLNSLTATAGTKTIKAKAVHGDMTGEQTITLEVANWVKSLSAVTEGVQLDHIVGDTISIDSFSGVRINVVYADTSANKQVTLTTTGVECVNNNDEAINFANLTNTEGTKVITVKYEGKTTSFSVSVVAQDSALDTLSVTSNPTVTSYTAGATGVSFDGLVITGVYKAAYAREDDVIAYANFATSDVTMYYNDAPITSLDSLTQRTPIGANVVTITISYLGKSTSFNLTVTNNVTELQILSNPTTLAYLLQDPFAYTGLSVKAIKNYGEEMVSIEDLAFFDGTTNVTNDLNALTATAGNKTVTIKFGGQENSFDITVTDYVVEVELEGTTDFETNVNKTEGSKFTDFTGLQVYAKYKSGNRPLISSGDYTVTGNEITAAGQRAVTISYAGKNNAGVVLLVKDILNSIVVDDSTVPTKIVKNGEVEKFLVNIRVIGTYEYRGEENINILQSNGTSFLYSVVQFALKTGVDSYQTLNQLSLDTISSEAGTRTIKLTYTYNGQARSDEFDITILAHSASISEFSLPQSLVKFNESIERGIANPTEADDGFEGALFADGTEEYLVGDDNPYRFVPTLNQIDIDEHTINTLASYPVISTIYLVDGDIETELYSATTGTYTKTWSSAAVDGILYVTETTNENKYQFTSAAIGKKFKISVLPDPLEFSYDSSLKAVAWTVKVVDGYNIYDSREICLLEQPSAATRATGRTYWDSIKTELGLTDVRPSSVLLHDSLVITKDSLPRDFWFTLDDNYEVYYNYNNGSTRYKPEDVPGEYGGPLERSFIWDEEWGLLQYDMNKGETFSIHGNYFDIDLSKLPLICAFDPKINYPEGRDAYYMDYMSKTTFIDIRGYDVRYANGVNGSKYTSDYIRSHYNMIGDTMTEDAEHDEHFIFENFAVKGNCSPKELLVDKSTVMKAGTDNPVYGGGIIFVKTHYCHSEIRNINAHSCFISFFTRDYTYADYINLKSYDTYLNALYALGETTVNLTNCHMKRAGGPLMIVTQQDDDLDTNSTDDEYIEIPRVIIGDDCVLENYVTGQEQWFDIFAPGQVDGLAALDGLLYGYFHKSFFNQEQDKPERYNKFNLICVSSQGQCYVSYKGEKMDRLKGSQPYPTTTYDIISLFNGNGAPAFSVGNNMCAIGQTEGGQYYLQNASQTELSQEDGYATIQAFSASHEFVTIHVGSGGAALGIFTGFFTKA